MKRSLFLFAALIVAAAGCVSTVQVNPLAHELAYQLTPTPAPDLAVNKTIAVVPFEDGRMYDGANMSTFTPMIVNFVPGIWSTTRVDSHPEVVHNRSVCGPMSVVLAAGTLDDAMPKLLADYLHRSRRFNNAVFVEAAEVAGQHNFDYVLRGRLVESQLVTKRYTYGVSLLAVVPHLLGAPVCHTSASLTVQWQLFDQAGRPVGGVKTATLSEPVDVFSGLYYGRVIDHKSVPLGLYVGAVREVNANIANDLSDMLADDQ